jgi:recombination associated protein RdgC
MTGWLAGGDAPDGFTVDQDCELAGVEKASVKYAHLDLGAEDIPMHIAAGKCAVRLAMTWRDKISFVLTDRWQVKRIAPLDVVKEQGAEAEDMFDGDFAIMSGELGLMLGELVSGMGGLVGKEVV